MAATDTWDTYVHKFLCSVNGWLFTPEDISTIMLATQKEPEAATVVKKSLSSLCFECFRPLFAISIVLIVLWTVIYKFRRSFEPLSSKVSKVQIKNSFLRESSPGIQPETDATRVIKQDRAKEGISALVPKQLIKAGDESTDRNRSFELSQLINPGVAMDPEFDINRKKAGKRMKSENLNNGQNTNMLRQQTDDKLKELHEDVSLTLFLLEKDKPMPSTWPSSNGQFRDDSIAKSELISVETDESSISDQKWLELEAVESESPSALQSKQTRNAPGYFYTDNGDLPQKHFADTRNDHKDQVFKKPQDLSDKAEKQKRYGVVELQENVDMQERIRIQTQQTKVKFSDQQEQQGGEIHSNTATVKKSKSNERGSSACEDIPYFGAISTTAKQRKKTSGESTPWSAPEKIDSSSFTGDVSDTRSTEQAHICEPSIQIKKENLESNDEADIMHGTLSGKIMTQVGDGSLGVDNGLWNKISRDAETAKQLTQDAEHFLEELKITSQANQAKFETLLNNVTTTAQSNDFLTNIGPVQYDNTYISPMKFLNTPNLQLKFTPVQSPAKFSVTCECMTFDITTTHTPSLCPTPETSCPCLHLARKLVDKKLTATEELLHESDMFQKRLKETMTPFSGAQNDNKLKSEPDTEFLDATCSPGSLKHSDAREANKILDDYLNSIQGHCKCFPKDEAAHKLCCEWQKKLKEFFSERTWKKSQEDLPNIIAQTLVKAVLESVLRCDLKQHSTDISSPKPPLEPKSEESDSGYKSIAQQSSSKFQNEVRKTHSALKTGDSAQNITSSPSKSLKKQISFATMREDIGVSDEWTTGESGNMRGQVAGPKTRTHHGIEETASHLVDIIVKESLSSARALKPDKGSCHSVSQDGININNAHSTRSVSSNSSDRMLSFEEKIKKINTALDRRGVNEEKVQERRESLKQEFQNADNVAQMINHFRKQTLDSQILTQSLNVDIFEKQLLRQQEDDEKQIVYSTERHSSPNGQHENQHSYAKQSNVSVNTKPRKSSKERKRQSQERQKSRNRNTSARSSDYRKNKRKMAGCSSSSESSPLTDTRDKRVSHTPLRDNFTEGYSLSSLVASTEDSNWKWLGISDGTKNSEDSRNKINDTMTNCPSRMPRQKKSVHYDDECNSEKTRNRDGAHSDKTTHMLTPEQQERILGPEKDYMLDIPNLAYHRDCQRCNDFVKGSHEYYYSPHFKPCGNVGHTCIQRDHVRTLHGKAFEYQDRQLQCSTLDEELPGVDIDVRNFKEPTKLNEILDVSKTRRRERYRHYFCRHQNSASNPPRSPLSCFDQRGRSYDQKGSASWTVKTIGSYSTPNNMSLTWNDIAREQWEPRNHTKQPSHRIC